MITIKRVDHVGIAVKNMDGVLPVYERLGIRAGEVEDFPDRGLRIAFLPAGECELELVEPTRSDSRPAKIIERQGEGIYHLCLAVEDVDGAVKELIEAGIQMIDRVPRIGGKGRKIAFIHPDSTHGALIELVQD